MDYKPTIDNTNGDKDHQFEGDITMKNVSFSYPKNKGLIS